MRRNRKSEIGNRQFPARLAVIIGLLAVLSIGVQAIFLVGPARRGFPLDDAWIHATYARNLARHAQLALNPGHPSTGTTSFLWTALLAAGQLALSDPVLPPIALNLAFQACLVVCAFLLTCDATGDRRVAIVAAASCALLGNLVWISLSGMEATLFVALALAAVWCHARDRLLAAGVLAGLLVLVRPEGLALPLAIGLVELPSLLRREAGLRPRWLRLFGPALAGAAVYVAINLAVSGRPLTSTFAGRRWLAGQPAHIDLGPIALGGRIVGYAGAWTRYLHRWVFGYALLLWLGAGEAAAAAGTAVAILVALAACLGLTTLWRTRRPERPTRSPFPLLLLWALLHNAAYVVLLPVHGHAGRYQTINFVLLALLVAAGLARLRRLGLVALAAWLALCVGSTTLWLTIYRNCVDHINSVHAACGRWIDNTLPHDAVVATYDLGAIAYFADRRIIDLGGLVDPQMARCLFDANVVPYLRQKGATHLALVQHNPGDLRLAERLGLLPASPPRPRLILLRAWAIPRESYALHHPATSNAMPRIALFRLQWPHPANTEPAKTPRP